MKFVKANLVLIICALVVLLSIGALYYPLGAKSKQLQSKMASALNSETIAHSLANTSISIPGEKSYNGPVTPAVIKAKKRVQEKIAAQARWVQRNVEVANARYRVRLPASGNGRVIPLLNLQPMRDLLPRPSRDAVIRGEFRRAYRRLFLRRGGNKRAFLTMLDAGMPPTNRRIKELVRMALRKQASIMPVGENGTANNGQHARLTREVVRRDVYRMASAIKLYASPRSFQIRRFIHSTTLPTADQIYEAFVDTWLQSDVVRAIATMDRSSANVGESPIKRLIHITVGNQAAEANQASEAMGATGGGDDNRATLVGDGHLFFGLGALAKTSNGNSTASPMLPSAGMPHAFPGFPGMPGGYPNMTGNPSMVPTSGPSAVGAMLTGHISNARYQVVLMEVSLVAEPWMLNKFINELYHQNNGYIVLNMETRTVDPITAITNGYVYGKVPVVRADILFECVMFSSWNRLVMPADYRAAFHLTGKKNAMR